MAAFDQSDSDRSEVGSLFGDEEALPEPLPADPWPLFSAWFDEAHARGATPNPNAMVLATADEHARPSGRVVLAKKLAPDGAYVVFFTNYESRKARELEANPRASAVFHWDALDRQARIEGPVTRSPDEESDAYFASRPWQSRLGAWASRQSRPLDSRQQMLDQIAETMAELGVGVGRALEGDVRVPRPPFWGGYRLWAERLELWMAGAGRVHDRAVWTRDLTPERGGYAPGPWAATRLQP